MKDIPNFPNYCITKTGKVWSKTRIDIAGRALKGKWLKGWKRKDGYLCITLHKDKKEHKKLVHRLILEAYVGLCPEGMEACHNDDNPTNNNISNLRWDTRKSNVKDSINHSLFPRGDKNGHAKLTKADVKMIIYIHKTGLFKQKEIANIYNISNMAINNIIHKKTWKHIWNS